MVDGMGLKRGSKVRFKLSGASARILAASLALTCLSSAAFAQEPVPAKEAAPTATVHDGDGVSRIAVVSAFEPEWQSLKADLIGGKTERINGVDFVTGTLSGKHVVLFLSGISMVNATMTTQLALDRFKIDAVVFSGIAGGVDPSLSIGDVVVAERWGEYLEAVFARKDGDGWALPSYAKKSFDNYGMIFPQQVEVRSDRSDKPEKHFWFETDGTLLDVARGLAEDIELEGCAGANTCLSKRPKIVVGGSGVSGMAFVDNAEFRQYVSKTFNASVLDMESAAVAHVAYANEVPFIAFRSLSDLAGGGEGANEMATFFKLASENSAPVVKAFVTVMPGRTD